MKFCITFGRTVEEYTNIHIEADDEQAANAQAERTLADEDFGDCDWELGDSHGERIVSIEEEGQP